VIALAERTPDRNPWFASATINAWWDKYQADGRDKKPNAIEGTRFRASNAGRCSRFLAYTFAGEEPSDPPGAAEVWRMEMGTLTHELVQEAVSRAFPGSECEVKVRHTGTDGSGHMDMLVRRDGRTSSVEIKTVGRYKFEAMTVGVYRKPPEGPSWSYVAQGSINAYSMDEQPDELVIVVLSLENIGADRAQLICPSEFARFSAQWTFSKEEYVEIAERELRRVDQIMQRTDADGPQAVERRLPDPRYGRNRVADPSTGLLTILDGAGEPAGKDKAWECGYCNYSSLCVADFRSGR
jgi:hypothetical protein